MKRIVGILLAAALVVSPPVLYAGSPRDAVDRPHVGSLRDAARREGARLAATSRPQPTAASTRPERNWVARHPVLFGTLAGAGIGLGFAAASDCAGSSDYTCSGIALFFAGTGAGLGALGGLAASLFLR